MGSGPWSSFRCGPLIVMMRFTVTSAFPGYLIQLNDACNSWEWLLCYLVFTHSKIFISNHVHSKTNRRYKPNSTKTKIDTLFSISLHKCEGSTIQLSRSSTPSSQGQAKPCVPVENSLSIPVQDFTIPGYSSLIVEYDYDFIPRKKKLPTEMK